MKAVRYDHNGGSEVLEYAEVPDPSPDRMDVVVRVEACALNRLDIVQREGWYHMPGFAYPHIPGMDVAGTVAAVGDDVTSVSVGERVVIDPSLSGVSVGSRFAGKGDLFGESRSSVPPRTVGTPSSASRLPATCIECPIACRSSMPRSSPRAG